MVIAVANLQDAARRYQALGFTLTPRAAHPDHMGTANRLAQFAGRNFIELVEVDRPRLLKAHDFDITPAHFGFGAHNQAYLAKRQGMSALVFATHDAEAEAERLADAGLTPYQPLHFERQATQPDGTVTTVAFTLAFATSPLMPEIAFYFCQNHYPENFWKPAFQSHANGAREITQVVLAAQDPDRHGDFLAALTGVAPGATQSLAIVRGESGESETLFTGLEIATTAAPPLPIEACGVALNWQKAIS